MDEIKLEDNSVIRVKTNPGLETTVFRDMLEIELEKAPFATNFEIYDASKLTHGGAPDGTFGVINFYISQPHAKVHLPGVVYPTRKGIVVSGCKMMEESFRKAVIDYNDHNF